MKQALENLLFANCANGTHEGGNISFRAQAPINQKNLFVTFADEDKTIQIAGSEHYVLGVCTDEATQAGDWVNVTVLGVSNSTLRVTTSEDIQKGDRLTNTNDGKAASLRTRPNGSYHIYGIALENAKAGETVEFSPLGSTLEIKS